MDKILETPQKGIPGFIDPPSPFDPLAELESFVRKMELMAGRLVEDARRIIAERKARGETY